MPTTTTAVAADPVVQADAARLGRAVARMRRAINRRVRRQIDAIPLPEAQLDVLRTVASAEAPPRIQDVAAQLRLAHNTVSTLVAAMVEHGLLAREPDPRDGRVVRLALTSVARRRLKLWHEHRAAVVAAHLAALPESQRRAVQRALPALEQLTASLESFGG